MSERIPEIAEMLPPRSQDGRLFRKRDLLFGLLYPLLAAIVLYFLVPLYVDASSEVVVNVWEYDFRAAFIGLFLVGVSLVPLMTAIGMARRAVRQALHRYRGVVSRAIICDFEKLRELTDRRSSGGRRVCRIDWRLDTELVDAPFQKNHVAVYRSTNEGFSPRVGDVIDVLVDGSGSEVKAFGDLRDYRESYLLGLVFFLGLCGITLALAGIASN